jgi:uncharacterized SAM-binding protein YcdF (DUF218 family)
MWQVHADLRARSMPVAERSTNHSATPWVYAENTFKAARRVSRSPAPRTHFALVRERSFMEHAISWTVKNVVNPPSLLALCLIAGAGLLWTHWAQLGRGLVTCSSLLAVVFGLLPSGTWMIASLERRFAVPDLPARIDGVIVLGGTMNDELSPRFHFPPLSESGDRFLAMLALMTNYPHARFVYTTNKVEAAAARRWMNALRIDPNRIVWDERSETTYENAIHAAELTRPSAQQEWLLVTSAYHMPRAVGVFRRANWNVIPYPVDQRTTGRYEFSFSLRPSERLYLAALATEEWLSLLAYWALDLDSKRVPAMLE